MSGIPYSSVLVLSLVFSAVLPWVGEMSVPNQTGIQISGNGAVIDNGQTVVSADDNTSFNVLQLGLTRTRSFLIMNTGLEGLSLALPIVISGRDAAAFSVIEQPADTLIAGAGTRFAIRYEPSATGLHKATVTLSDPAFSFDISGIGDGDDGTCLFCFDKLSTASNVCFGRGECVSEVCSCNPFFGGSECEIEFSFSSGRKATFPNFSFSENIFVGPVLPRSGSVYTWTMKITGNGWLGDGMSIGLASIAPSNTMHQVGADSAEWSYIALDGSKISNNVKASYGPPLGINDEIRMTLDREANTLSYAVKKAVPGAVFIDYGVAFIDVVPAAGKQLAVAVSTKCMNGCSITFIA